jgi:hypothetical protein
MFLFVSFLVEGPSYLTFKEIIIEKRLVPYQQLISTEFHNLSLARKQIVIMGNSLFLQYPVEGNWI